MVLCMHKQKSVYISTPICIPSSHLDQFSPVSLVAAVIHPPHNYTPKLLPDYLIAGAKDAKIEKVTLGQWRVSLDLQRHRG